jgi:hypothetical protein
MVFPGKRRAVPSALRVVCIRMKCVHFVRLLTTHIIVSYPWDSGSSTMKSTLIVSHGTSGVSEGWSSPIGHRCCTFVWLHRLQVLT